MSKILVGGHGDEVKKCREKQNSGRLIGNEFVFFLRVPFSILLICMPSYLQNDEVDLTISKMVVINADIQFKHLLRIDGRFEGKLIPNVGASVIVTQRGHYLGDIIGLDLAYVDGKVEGDISVNALELGPHANVCGNILCKRIVIAGHAKFSGELNVTPSNIIPPPPAPPTSALTTEPETVDEQDGSDIAKELHLVEDDEMACAVPPRIIDETAESDSSDLHESFSAPLPRKSSALIIYEPQVDLLAQSDLWPELESQESAKEQLSALDRLCDWITREGEYLDHILVLLDIHYVRGCMKGVYLFVLMFMNECRNLVSTIPCFGKGELLMATKNKIMRVSVWSIQRWVQ